MYKKILEQNDIINENDYSVNNCQSYELILIPSLESDGYEIPPLFIHRCFY
jgi:hypothetical protein